MSERKKLSRRALLTAGVGLAAGAAGPTIGAGMRAVTPANPEGPFYPTHQQADKDADLTLIEGRDRMAEGQVIRVTGQVLDEDGQPIAGALVDVWQANTWGRYHHEADPATAPVDPGFQGWAMIRSDAEGRYAFRTIKPGAYKVGGNWTRPPHIHFRVSRRGYHELTTQMYFAGEALNEKDRLLQSVPAGDRDLLVVEFDESTDIPSGHFPVVLARVV
ncbi:dioxygenase family protein [Lentisalinibacter sediminis]|uniref:dioxygenase family protein n=1 Tax=Lentisalinibacter sediminis TaxID=2992237 RepID=UPI003867CE48